MPKKRKAKFIMDQGSKYVQRRRRYTYKFVEPKKLKKLKNWFYLKLLRKKLRIFPRRLHVWKETARSEVARFMELTL